MSFKKNLLAVIMMMGSVAAFAGNAAEFSIFGAVPEKLPVREQLMDGRAAFAFDKESTIAVNQDIKTGFYCSFWLRPSWYPGDLDTHRILSLNCQDNEGNETNLGLDVLPSGSLELAVNRPQWIGGVVSADSLLWSKGEWQFVSCGWTPENGFFLKLNGFNENKSKIAEFKSLKRLKSVKLIGKPDQNSRLWLGDFQIDAVPPKKAACNSTRTWQISPNGNWNAGDISLPCHGSVRRLAASLTGQPGALYLDCPDGIVPSQIISLDYDARTIARQDGKKVMLDDKSFTRYVYPFGEKENSLPLLHQSSRGFSVCLQSSLSPGTVSSIVVGYISPDGNAESGVRYPVESIVIVQAGKLKKLVTGLSITRTDTMAQTDAVKLYKRMSLTFVDLWDYGYWIGRRDKKYIDDAKTQVAMLRKNDIVPVLEIHRALWEYRPEDCKAVDINGKKYATYSSRCPSDRGQNHFFDQESVKLAVAIGAGASLDIESTGLNQNTPCFCPECLKAFNIYRAEQHPEAADTDPLVFEKDRNKYPELHKIWCDFIGYQTSRMAYAFYQAQAEAANEMKERQFMVIYDEGLWPSGCDLSWLSQAKPNRVELFMGPPLYHKAAANYKTLCRYRAKLPQARVMPYIGFSYDQYENDMISQVLCMFGGGAQGIIIWSWASMSGRELADTAIALNAVAKVEDILTEGKETTQPVFDKLEGMGRIVRLGNKAVLLVGNGDSQGIKVTLPFKVKTAVNLLTDESLLITDGVLLQLQLSQNIFRLYVLELEQK